MNKVKLSLSAFGVNLQRCLFTHFLSTQLALRHSVYTDLICSLAESQPWKTKYYFISTFSPLYSTWMHDSFFLFLPEQSILLPTPSTLFFLLFFWWPASLFTRTSPALDGKKLNENNLCPPHIFHPELTTFLNWHKRPFI